MMEDFPLLLVIPVQQFNSSLTVFHIVDTKVYELALSNNSGHVDLKHETVQSIFIVSQRQNVWQFPIESFNVSVSTK